MKDKQIQPCPFCGAIPKVLPENSFVFQIKHEKSCYLLGNECIDIRTDYFKCWNTRYQPEQEQQEERSCETCVYEHVYPKSKVCKTCNDYSNYCLKPKEEQPKEWKPIKLGIMADASGAICDGNFFLFSDNVNKGIQLALDKIKMLRLICGALINNNEELEHRIQELEKIINQYPDDKEK